MFTRENKLCDLAELLNWVHDGDTVAVGGGLSWREPMAVLRELIRQNKKKLKVVGSAHGIDIDLLCGAGSLAASGESYVGFEQDFGMAANYRRACENGSVKVEDNCCYTLVQQLRAAISGLPFMPVRSVQGTDFMTLHPEFKTMDCPFTGERLVLVPAMKPDVAIIHAHFADKHGNIHIDGPPVADILFAKASKNVIVTAEQILSHDELVQKGVTIPYFYVTAVSEVTCGAHPTSCYPNYAYDRKHTSHYYQSAKQGLEMFHDNYLQPYVYQCRDNDDYLEAIGGWQRLEILEEWHLSRDHWMQLYE